MSLETQIEALEKALDADVIVIGNSWSSGRAYDLDWEAGRVFVEGVSLRAAKSRPRAAIVLACTGGHPSFAQTAVRAIRAHYATFDVVVPYMTNGAGALIALAADNILLHPYAGVGALDVGPINPQVPEMDSTVYEDVPALGGLGEVGPELVATLAAERHWKRMARNLARRLTTNTIDALLLDELGEELHLGSAELAEHGFSAALCNADSVEAVWSLYRDLEEVLGLLTEPPPRYSESDLANEVEFEPAFGLVGGLFASTAHRSEYIMDTGRPHPDTNVFAGEWAR